MIARSAAIRVALFVIGLVCGVAPFSMAQSPVVEVGIVLDGPWERNDETLAVFQKETLDLTRPEFDVRFPPDKRLLADFTLAGVQAAVDGLLADPDVDLVLTLGPIASAYACRLSSLPKPVIAAFVLDAEVQGIPVDEGADGERVSGFPNLTYITFAGEFQADVNRFREVVPFHTLTYLGNKGLAEAIPELEGNLLTQIDGLDVDLRLVLVGSSIDEALASIPADTEAVYVAPLFQLPAGDFDRLVAGLVERRLPSFSLWGRSEVDRGLLTSTYLDTDILRLGRRVAVNVQRVILGDDEGQIPVDFRRDTRLTINMATSVAIGVYPNWSVITEAELLHERATDDQRRLTLLAVALEAIAANRDLAVANRFVAVGAQNVRFARSDLFPRLDVTGSTQVIDRDRAEASLGFKPRRLLVGSTTLTQLLYSERVRSNISIEGHIQRSREYQRDATRADVVLDATVGYLDVLRAQTLERIERDNLAVTRSNLELAQERQRIGVSRAAEVIRWESQMATDRRAVLDADVQRSLATIALNRLLHRPAEEGFVTDEADLDDPALLLSPTRLEPYIENPFAYKIFRNFMTEEALAVSPELRQLEAAISAQERALLSARRAFWLPTVALQADLSGIADGLSEGAGEPSPMFGGLQAGKWNWTIGVNMSLPLFTGGARRAERDQATLEMTRLRLEHEATVERVEQSIRSALHLAGASYAGIELAVAATDAARRNLELVTGAYTSGAIAILDVLDAQNAARVAEQVAANARYDHLIDLMQVQRALGRFDFFMGPDERRAFLERLDAFYARAGYMPRPRQ